MGSSQELKCIALTCQWVAASELRKIEIVFGLKGKQEAPLIAVFLQRKEKKLTSRKALSFFGRGDGGDDLLVDFCSSQRSNPTPTEKRDEYTVFDIEVAVIEYF